MIIMFELAAAADAMPRCTEGYEWVAAQRGRGLRVEYVFTYSWDAAIPIGITYSARIPLYMTDTYIFTGTVFMKQAKHEYNKGIFSEFRVFHM